MVAVWLIFWMMVFLQIVLFLVELELQANIVRSSQLITSKEVSPTRAMVPHIALHVIIICEPDKLDAQFPIC